MKCSVCFQFTQISITKYGFRLAGHYKLAKKQSFTDRWYEFWYEFVWLIQFIEYFTYENWKDSVKKLKYNNWLDLFW